ncbi:HTH_Tnp_Tc3_2 domain-containing protein [Trichonephila clavipes]|nr:HTH_Tnp_Tc3_2 domain-containing protein [Trichonephila clavipes]
MTHGPFNFGNHQTARIFKTVLRVYQEYIDDGHKKTGDWANCKGQLALTERGERRFRRVVRSHQSQTLSQITTQFYDGSSHTVSKWTVHRLLHHKGFGSDLREYHSSMIAIGLHVWSVEDWNRLAWRDEYRFRLLNADRRLRIRRQAHEVMDPACQVKIVLEHCGSIMVWDVLSWHCLGSLLRVPTSLNAIRYAEFLGYHLHSFMLFCYPHGNLVFHQDNCTSHKSRLATSWLHEHCFDFSVIIWSPRSQDLNPI